MAAASFNTKKRILIAVDTSSDSKLSVSFVMDMICKQQDEIFVFYARPAVPLVTGEDPDFIFPTDLRKELNERSRLESEQVLNFYSNMATNQNKICQIYSMEGDPTFLILSEAKKKQIDLVVLGSRGHGLMARVLFGSVCGHVVHNASCPVLVVRGLQSKDSCPGVKRRTVLFAIDDSMSSQNAFRWALRNASYRENDHLVLMTAQSFPKWIIYSDFTTFSENFEIGRLQQKRQLLHNLNNEAKNWGKDCTLDIIHGDAREAISMAVSRYNADLLVIGSKDQGSLSRFLLGSVSSYCCYNSNCPVLIVRTADH